MWGCCFFFQAEDGIRDAQESRGLGDVYKRQEIDIKVMAQKNVSSALLGGEGVFQIQLIGTGVVILSLIHI